MRFFKKKWMSFIPLFPVEKFMGVLFSSINRIKSAKGI